MCLLLIYYVCNSCGTEASPCATGWRHYEEEARCYFANDQGLKKFSKARRFCEDLEATMVSVGSQQEDTFINGML